MREEEDKVDEDSPPSLLPCEEVCGGEALAGDVLVTVARMRRTAGRPSDPAATAYRLGWAERKAPRPFSSGSDSIKWSGTALATCERGTAEAELLLLLFR